MADKTERSKSSSTFFYFLALIIVVIATFASIQVFQPFRDYVENLMPFTARETIFHGRIFTKEELSQFTGANDGDVYLAILGDVYDVTKGRKHYGVGGGYHFFSGGFNKSDHRKPGSSVVSMLELGPHTWQGKVMLSFEWITLMSALSYGSGC